MNTSTALLGTVVVALVVNLFYYRRRAAQLQETVERYEQALRVAYLRIADLEEGNQIMIINHDPYRPLAKPDLTTISLN